MNLAKELPPVEELRECLEYREGHLYWIKKVNYRSPVGSLAEGKSKGGYRRTSLNGRRWPTHRLIWSLHHGYLSPKLEVDHINRVRNDNRIENLRAVSHLENSRNTPVRITNRTGTSGVRLHAEGFWSASFKVDGRFVYLGSYETEAEAIAARRAVEVALWNRPPMQRATSEEMAQAA